MGLADDIKAGAKDTYCTQWSVRDGQKVPGAKDVALGNDAGGTVGGYDGDRVMAVFIGDSQCNDLLRCAFRINYAVRNIVQPELEAHYSSSTFKIRHTAGLDTGSVRTVRSGARGDKDLVWVGNSANLAAKLTGLHADYATWITNRVYEKLNGDNKCGISNGSKVSMWREFAWSQHNNDRVWASTWWRCF